MKRTAILFWLVLVSGGPAHALIADIWTRTSLQFVNLAGAEASATAIGLATLTTSSSTSSHLMSLALSAQTLNSTVPITDPNAAPITAVRFSVRQRPDLQGGGVLGNISGAVASTAGALTPRTIPMTGGITICLLNQHFPPCDVVKLDLPVGETSAGIQVGLGVGGIMTIGFTGSIRISLVGAPYTVKSVSLVNETLNGAVEKFVEQGFAHGPLSLTSSTAQTSGVLQILTATRTTVVAPGGTDLSHISRILIHIVPEPELLLLFGAGAAGLALLGRKRMRG